MPKTVTYTLLVRLTALMLLAGVVMPTGLHAKQLIDFCLSGQNEHPMSRSADTRSSGHDCPNAESEPASHQHAASHDTGLHDSDTHRGDSDHQDCEGDLICACNIDHAPLSDQSWLQSSHSNLSGLMTVSMISPDRQSRLLSSTTTITYTTPPLFLLNSTFLN